MPSTRSTRFASLVLYARLRFVSAGHLYCRTISTDREWKSCFNSTGHFGRPTDSNVASTSSSSSSLHEKVYRFSGQTTPNSKQSGVTVLFSTGQTIQTDLPLTQGGTNQAPQPVELLLAAWAGCTQATARFVGRQMVEDITPTSTTTTRHTTRRRIVLDRLEFVDIVAVRDERGAIALPITNEPPLINSRIHTILGTVHVYYARGNDGDHHHHQPLEPGVFEFWKAQTELRCPIANMMLASGCRIDVQWVDANNLPETSSQYKTGGRAR